MGELGELGAAFAHEHARMSCMPDMLMGCFRQAAVALHAKVRV